MSGEDDGAASVLGAHFSNYFPHESSADRILRLYPEACICVCVMFLYLCMFYE